MVHVCVGLFLNPAQPCRERSTRYLTGVVALRPPASGVEGLGTAGLGLGLGPG